MGTGGGSGGGGGKGEPGQGGKKEKGKKPKAPHEKLPKDTPKEIVDFVSCTSDSVTLKKGKSPIKIDLGIEVQPEISFEAKPGGGVQITLTIGKKGDLISKDFKVDGKVNADGQLEVDTSSLPVGKDAADKWVKDFNDHIKKNGKKIKEVNVKDGNLVIDKALIAAVPGQAVGPGGGGGGRKKRPRRANRRTAAAVGTAVAVGTAAIGFTLFGGDDSSPKSESVEALGGESGTAGDCGADLASGGDAGLGGTAFAHVPVWADPANHAPCDEATGGYGGDAGDASAGFVGSASDVLVSHDGSVPDAKTGDEGLSTGTLVFMSNLPSVFNVDVTATCAGREVHGAGTGSDSGRVEAPFPLFSFGQCDNFSGMVTGPGGVTFPLPEAILPNQLQVTAAEGSTVPGAAEQISDWELNARWAHAELEMLNPIAVGDRSADALFLKRALLGTDVLVELEPDLRELHPGEGAREPTAIPYLVNIHETFVAGEIRPRLFGNTTTESYSNEAAEVLFNQSLFPCGPGRIAFTACTADGPDVESGAALIATTVLDSPASYSGSGQSVTFEIDGDGDGKADQSYEAALEDGAWVLTAAGTGRVMVRDHAVTLFAPLADFGGDAPAGIRVVAKSGKGASTMPADGFDSINDQAFPVPQPSGVDATKPADGASAGDDETPEEFLADLAVAIREHDVDFLLEHVHSVVLARYDEATCREHLDALAPVVFADPDLEIGRASGEAPFDYASDGESVTVDKVVTVPVTGAGEAIDVHVAFEDGRWRWFTDCTPATPPDG